MKMKAALFAYCLLVTGICSMIILRSVRDFKNRKTFIKPLPAKFSGGRPKVSDSLRILENFYHSQLKQR